MSGIREWLPFQQGVFLAKIESELTRGKAHPTISKVAKAAGISAGRATRLLRSHYAYAQSAADEEYGDVIKEDKFAMFNEAVFRAADLQKWLGWNDDTRSFEDIENFRHFLSWITPSDLEGQPRLLRAVDARDVLPGIIGDAVLLPQFEAGEITVDQARVELNKKRGAKPEDLGMLLRRLDEILATLDSLPTPQIIRDGKQSDFAPRLENVAKTVELQLKSLR